MFVIYEKKSQKVPIKVWLGDKSEMEAGCIEQALMVSNHPAIYHHLALMPDTHQGYALPIGGVAALDGVISPYFVGVDIGCGMGAVKTSLSSFEVGENQIRLILDLVKKFVPMGEGVSHDKSQEWSGFDAYMSDASTSGWIDDRAWELAEKNLGTLGGGNHFIEIQKSTDGDIWIMIHTGSRNLGYRIANYYHDLAVSMNKKWHSSINNDLMAFLPVDSSEGKSYIKDMNFALHYAKENRRRIMEKFKLAIITIMKNVNFVQEINIHHNFASLENHFGKNVWVHRKGATSAKADELGIIPGSMGTSSYIVKGLGNFESFMSCSHGAGRKMGRSDASRNLSKEDCDKAMSGIIFDGYQKLKARKEKDEGIYDLGESPLAYKNIDQVIAYESDLVEPLVKLSPLGVLKG